MIIIELPFDIEHPDIKAGFENGTQPIYRNTRPVTDEELVKFINDVISDNPDRLAYNIGFLLGLYQPEQPKAAAPSKSF